MAENYFPSAKDFDEMENYLALIAMTLTDKAEVEISDWSSIQRAVRMGLAPEKFPIGTQLVANHSVYGDLVLDVVAHDHYKASHSDEAHTMTLMCHDVITSIRFDEPEAFYCAEKELPAGTYNFTLTTREADVVGTYQFTLYAPLPKGGVLMMYPRDLTTAMETKTVAVFDFPTKPQPNATTSIAIGNEGTSLGTLGIELNHLSRVMKGSGNYKESAIRQFVNSTADPGVWRPQTKFDFHPEWYRVLAGFANGLDKNLLAVVGEVKVPCLANGRYESPDSTVTIGQKYILNDKFYIPSGIEVGMEEVGLRPYEDGSTLLPYFKGSSNADRIKKLGINASGYWLRSSYLNEPHITLIVRENGDITATLLGESLGVVPMFNIV